MKYFVHMQIGNTKFKLPIENDHDGYKVVDADAERIARGLGARMTHLETLNDQPESLAYDEDHNG